MIKLKVSVGNPESSNSPNSFVRVKFNKTESFKRTAITEALSIGLYPVVSYTTPVIFMDWDTPFRLKNKIKIKGKKNDFMLFSLGIN